MSLARHLAAAAAWLPAAALLAVASPAATAELERIDRVVAVVDDDPILASDLDVAIGLGLVERQSGEGDDALRRRVLDWMIEERLRFHELDRFGFADVPIEAVEEQYAAIVRRLGGAEAAREELAKLGFDEAALHRIVARQLMVLTYVEQRLGPRVFVGIDDIRAYYEETLVPEMRRRGEPAPPIEQVREQIRALLKEQRLNEEIARWTEELRAEADVVNYFDSEHPELPPLVNGSAGSGAETR